MTFIRGKDKRLINSSFSAKVSLLGTQALSSLSLRILSSSKDVAISLLDCFVSLAITDGVVSQFPNNIRESIILTLKEAPSAQRMRCLIKRLMVETASAGAWMYGVKATLYPCS